MDNGKLRLQPFNRATICEAYTSDEITSDDIEWVMEILRERHEPPYLLIIVRSGKYSMSIKAQLRIFMEHSDDLKVAYVAKTSKTLHHALEAGKTYLQNKDVFICDGINSAYRALTAVI